MADPKTDPTPVPPEDPPPSPPPSSDPAPSLDEASIGDLIERKVKALFKEQAPAPKPGPAGEPVDIEGKIAAAVATAMQERDKEDQVFVLQAEIDKLKEQFAKGSAERKRGWGSYILGPGLVR
jgi:hypothetical protein